MKETFEIDDYEIITQHLVMNKDLNIAGTLFGGIMMGWIDEAAAMYAMKVMRTKMIVTHLISELEFDKPVKLGDFLVFGCKTVRTGKTSLSVSITVYKYDFTKDENGKTVFKNTPVVSAKIIFVSVDENGNKKEWEKE